MSFDMKSYLKAWRERNPFYSRDWKNDNKERNKELKKKSNKNYHQKRKLQAKEKGLCYDCGSQTNGFYRCVRCRKRAIARIKKCRPTKNQ